MVICVLTMRSIEQIDLMFISDLKFYKLSCSTSKYSECTTNDLNVTKHEILQGFLLNSVMIVVVLYDAGVGWS